MTGKEFLVGVFIALGVGAELPQFIMGLFLAALLGVFVASRQRRKLGIHSLAKAILVAVVVALMAAQAFAALEWTRGIQLTMAIAGGLSSYFLGALTSVGETIEGGAGGWLSAFVQKFTNGSRK